MNKKIVLGLLALSSVSSFASAGYIETNNKGEFIEVKETKHSDEHKIDAALFLGKNRDFAVFTGSKFQLLGGTSFDGYFGSRLDTKVSSNTRLALTTVVNKGAVSEKPFIEQLKYSKDMKDWDGKKDKDSFFSKGGIRINQKDGDEINKKGPKESIFLLSGTVEHTFDKLDLNYGVVYNIDNSFPDKGVKHRVESFAGLKTKFDNVNVEGNINHVIGNYKAFQLDVANSIFEPKPHEKFENSFEKGGRLKGDIKLSGKVSDISLSTKLLADHSNIKNAYVKEIIEETNEKAKEGTISVNFKGGIENRLSYNKDGFKVDANLDYKNTLFIATGELKGVSSYKASDKKALLHNPEVVLKLEKDFGNFKLRSNTTDTANAQQILSKIEKTDQSKPDAKIIKFDNLFFTDNAAEYKAVDGLTVGLRAKALNYIDKLEKNDSDPEKPYKYHYINTKLGVGPTVKYEKTFGDLSVKSHLGAAYVLDYTSKLNNGKSENPIKHNVVSFALNEAKYKLNDNFSFEGNVNLVDKVSDIKKAAKPSNDLYVQLRFKPIYTNNGVTLSNETNFYTHLMNKKFTFGVTVDPEVKYEANENVTLGSKLGFVYRNELKSHTEIKHQFNVAKDLTFGHDNGLDKPKDIKYEDKVDKVITDKNIINPDGDVKKAIDSEKGEMDKNVSVFNVAPSVYINMKFLDKKLSVEPKLELGINTVRNKDNESLKLTKVTGKGTLKVEYKW